MKKWKSVKAMLYCSALVGLALGGCSPEQKNTGSSDKAPVAQENAPSTANSLEEPPSPLEKETFSRTARALTSGWTLWSPDRELLNAPITDVISQSNLDKINSVWSWSAADEKWEVFFPDQTTIPEGYLPLTTISSGKGYWFYSRSTIDITLLGDLPSKQTLSFQDTDWHLVGFGGSGVPADLTSLVQTENDDPFCVWGFRENSWDIFCSNETIAETNERLGVTWLQPLESFEPGIGYWVHSSSGELSTSYPPSPLTFREFVFPQSNSLQDKQVSASHLARSGVEELTRTSILDGGKRIVIEFKNGNQDLIPCATGETTCVDGVRTYQSADLVNNTFNLITTTGFISYFNAKIYDSNNDLVYETQTDIAVTPSGSEFLNIDIHLLPAGVAILGAGSLDKTIEFTIPLTDVTSSIFASADSNSIVGEFNCAQPSNEQLSGYPFTINFIHDAANKELKASPVDMGSAYVGSPCTLEVSSKENNVWQLEGGTQFNVDANQDQSAPAIEFVHNVQAVEVSISQEGTPGELVIEMEKDPLDSSIRTFLNAPNASLSYRVRLKNDTFDKTTTLSVDGSKLKGTIDYPLNQEVDLSLLVLKGGTSWISSTQKATFDEGTTTVPSFTVVFTKVIGVETSTTKGNIILTAISGDTVLSDADVAITLVGSSDTWQGKTDASGRVFYFGRSGLPSGNYQVTVSKYGYFDKMISFELAENGAKTEIVELAQNKIFTESILLNESQAQQLNQWYSDPNQEWTLCYRRSTHGANSSTFHNRCDGQGATFTIATLNSGKFIGGYASQSWSSNNDYYGDSRSFLFSLTNNFKHEHYQNSHYQRGGGNYGPTFGGGHDWYINPNMTNGYTNLGHDYRCRTAGYRDTICRNDFAGSYNGWVITELEVFHRK